MPQPARPSRQVVACCSANWSGRDAGLLGVALVDPGAEVGGRQLGEQQEQVGQIALGVDEQAGHARREALLDQHDAETGLARTGHAHDHAVRGEVAAREGDGGVGALVGGRVDHGAEGQVCHPGNVGPGQAEHRAAGGGASPGQPSGGVQVAGTEAGTGGEAQSPRQPGERVLQCRGPEREVVPARAEQHAGLAEARCGDLGESLGGGRGLRVVGARLEPSRALGELGLFHQGGRVVVSLGLGAPAEQVLEGVGGAVELG